MDTPRDRKPPPAGTTEAVSEPSTPESWAAPIYFGLYLAYLFFFQESEIHHWGTLVALPAVLVWFFRRKAGRPLASTLGSFGLRRGNLTRGLGLTLVLGVAIGLVQVFASRSGPAVLDAVADGSVLWRFPLAFVLLLFLTGFTEEFFFRGFLQTRIESILGSKVGGLILTALLFGVYHVPYAYFNPNWPSAGDWGAAWASALGQGIPGGLILGGVLILSRGNLVACIILHALVDTFPAMTMIRFGGG